MSDVSLPDAQEPEDDKKWYYSIELENGVTTKGNDHANLATTRSLLRAVAFEEQDCLDIGTQEAVIPILLKKGGAKRMVAYDRRDLSDRLANLQRIYGVNFDYIAGRQLTELPGILDAPGRTVLRSRGVLRRALSHDQSARPARVGARDVQDRRLVRDRNRGASGFSLRAHLQREGLVRRSVELFHPDDHVAGLRPALAWPEATRGELCGELQELGANQSAVLCRSEATACPLDPGDTWASAPFHERAFRSESQVDWEGLRKTSSSIGLKETLPSLRGTVYDA
jgi:hypothetical protein